MKAMHILVITLSTFFSGCIDGSSQGIKTKMATQSKTNNPNAINYLALGDSYTIGESVPQEQSFPYQLTQRVNATALKVNVPNIIAVTGWTTDDLINAIDQSDIKTNKYDLVTLLIGVNDQYQGMSRQNYKTKFLQLLNTAIGFANGDANRVFVLSIPDYGVTPFAAGQDHVIGPEIDQFNAINRAASLNAGVHYIDITPESREAANNPDLIAADGLHPSGQMYAKWIDLLAPPVLKMLHKK